MTDQTLAEELEALASVSATGNLMIPAGPNCINRANTQLLQTVRNNLPAILSALREREVMREALAEWERARIELMDFEKDNPRDCGFEWDRLFCAKDNATVALQAIARAALQGGGE